MLEHINPLDGKTFVVDRFHEAPQHYLKARRRRQRQTAFCSRQRECALIDAQACART